MKKTVLVFLIMILAVFIITGNSFAADTGLSGGEKKSKKEIRLFNGKNLDGWYTFIKDRGRDADPKNVFTVQKGIIRISGEEYGCITTDDEFENYSLTVWFKWGDITWEPRTEKARDSGILLHSVGEDGSSSGTWMYSLECQIIEGGTGDFIIVGDGSSNFSLTCPVAPQKQGGSYVFHPSGEMATINSGRINWFGRDPGWKDSKGFLGVNDLEKPVGKWNKIECIVNEGEIIIYLNGTLVNHAFDVKPQRGRIQIQSEGAEIFFRKIVLTQL